MTFNTDELMEMAIQIEKNGKEYYALMTEKSHSPEVRQVFEYLGREEQSHLENFVNKPMAARLMHQASPVLPEGQISAENLQTALEAFAGEIARAYDGDDRSAILISLEKSDLTAGEPHELELFEHFNKEYRFPLRAPLLAAAGSALSGLLALFRMRRHLPKLLAILGKKD